MQKTVKGQQKQQNVCINENSIRQNIFRLCWYYFCLRLLQESKLEILAHIHTNAHTHTYTHTQPV